MAANPKKIYAECTAQGNFKQLVSLEYSQVINDEIFVSRDENGALIQECRYIESEGCVDEFYYLEMMVV